MKGSERLATIFAGILFAVFFLNVILGAARIGAFLGDVGEMLVMFGACVVFVIAILGHEQRARALEQEISKQGGES